MASGGTISKTNFVNHETGQPKGHPEQKSFVLTEGETTRFSTQSQLFFFFDETFFWRATLVQLLSGYPLGFDP